MIEHTGSHDIERIRGVILAALRQTSLGEDVDRFDSVVDGGKMLRGRLVLELGAATGVAPDALSRLAAAVELLHAGSLLHDDIIDGGTERRSAPALWVSEGAKAAVLVGDLLLSIALGFVQEFGPDRMAMLTNALREMCDAEAEQELSRGDNLDSWQDCVRIARRKTGALFGFAAACAAGADAELAVALESAGNDLGTAYQLADDMLDTCGDDAIAGKSVGSDAATGKLTAVSASVLEGIDPVAAIDDLLVSADNSLAKWPDVHQRWADYIENVIQPLMRRYAGVAKMDTVLADG